VVAVGHDELEPPAPGTSTTRIAAGVVLAEPRTAASCGRRSSGIVATPTLGLSVMEAYAVTLAPACVSALKRTVLPELGRPTIPTCKGTSA
jgi:hypothetical protein